MIHIEEGNELHVEHFSLNSILGPPGKNKFQFLTPNEKEWECCKHYTKRSMGTQFIHFENGFYTRTIPEADLTLEFGTNDAGVDGNILS